MKRPDVAVAMDLGTTHLKCLAVAADGRVLYHQQSPTPFFHESGVKAPAIDAQAVWRWVADQLAVFSGQPWVVAFSSAMHSLVVADGDGHLVDGKAYTWMDVRAASEARQLRQNQGSLWREQTGTPVHAMSVVVKWAWWKKAHPAQPECMVVGLKDWIVFQLCGQWLTDWTSASGTGFLNIGQMDWDGEILRAVGLGPEDLPAIVSPETRWQVAEGEVVIGGADSALAHFGLGVDLSAPAWVLSLGTSGAIRTNLGPPLPTVSSNFFCYRAVQSSQYLLGEAYSNIGNLLEWVASQHHTPVSDLLLRGMSRLRQRGAIPFLVPYLYGERSPYWDERLYAQWLDLTGRETSDDFFAGAVAALLTILFGGSARLQQAAPGLATIRSGSAILDQPRFAQAVANVSRHPLSVEQGVDASILGAMRLAEPSFWQAMATSTAIRQLYQPEDLDGSFWHDRYHRLSEATRRQLAGMRSEASDIATWDGGNA